METLTLSSRRFAGAMIALLLGCAGATTTASDRAGDSLLRLVIMNDLSAPITVAVDDTVMLILRGGVSSGLAVRPSAQWLTWTSAKPTDTAGTPIPDDIGTVRVRLTGLPVNAEITNVINDTAYVTAELSNPTSSRVSIGIFDGSTVSCVSVLRAAAGAVPGFTKIGYYRLLARTEIRAYRDEAHCTGPFLSWPASQLATFEPKSGLVRLILTAPP